MYKVVLIDDEAIILEGLQKVVDWALFGLWRWEREAYAQGLNRHIGRHLDSITGKPLRG